MKLTIVRSKWLRGEGSGDSYLRRPADGKMCCLGFLALACGTEGSIDECRCPSDAAFVTWPKELRPREGIDRRLTTRIMKANDDTTSTDAQREERVSTLLKQAGVEVTFID